MMKKCKYYDPQMILIANMISTLYDDFECLTGALCHIVTDDDNITDSDLQAIIDECNKRENNSDISTDVSKYICESMLKLNLIQREFLFGILNEGLDIRDFGTNGECYYTCDSSCPFKRELNRFHAEHLCIEKYHNNEKFLTGEFPIENLD